jgi:drug/metabolite transporter (DMT)-like permease
MGGLSMTVGVMLFFLAVERTPIIVVSPLTSLQPVFALAEAHLFLQRLEKITLPLVLGTLIIVGGVIAITFGIET